MWEGKPNWKGLIVDEFKGFPVAMKQFFGLKPGQKTPDFVRELKALTIEDKRWFKTELVKLGYSIGE